MAVTSSLQQRTLEEAREAVERVIAFGPGLAMVEPFASLRTLLGHEELPKGAVPIVEAALEKLLEFVEGWNRAEDRGKRAAFRDRHDAAADLRAAIEKFRKDFDPDATIVRHRR